MTKSFIDGCRILLIQDNRPIDRDPLSLKMLNVLGGMSSLQNPTLGGTSVHKAGHLNSVVLHSLRNSQVEGSVFRKHALRTDRRVSRALPNAALSVTATIASRPRIDAAPTVRAGSDGNVLDCVVVGGGISGLVAAQVHLCIHSTTLFCNYKAFVSL